MALDRYEDVDVSDIDDLTMSVNGALDYDMAGFSMEPAELIPAQQEYLRIHRKEKKQFESRNPRKKGGIGLHREEPKQGHVVCPHCYGKGYELRTYNEMNGPQRDTCRKCYGKGQIDPTKNRNRSRRRYESKYSKLAALPMFEQMAALQKVSTKRLDEAWVMADKIVKEEDGHKNGTYSSLLVRNRSKDELLDWCERAGVPCNTEDKLHCTLIYSKKPVPSLQSVDGKRVHIEAETIGWKVLGGSDEDPTQCLVLIINSPDIIALNKKMTEMGAVSDYPEYIQHVTVNSDWKGTIPEAVPNFDIGFNKIEVTPLEDDYYNKEEEEEVEENNFSMGKLVVREDSVPSSDPVYKLKKLMSEPMLANDIGKQMEAYFVIPDPSMIHEFRKVRGNDGDKADLRPTLKDFMKSQLHPDILAQMTGNPIPESMSAGGTGAGGIAVGAVSQIGATLKRTGPSTTNSYGIPKKAKKKKKKPKRKTVERKTIAQAIISESGLTPRELQKRDNFNIFLNKVRTKSPFMVDSIPPETVILDPKIADELKTPADFDKFKSGNAVYFQDIKGEYEYPAAILIKTHEFGGTAGKTTGVANRGEIAEGILGVATFLRIAARPGKKIRPAQVVALLRKLPKTATGGKIFRNVTGDDRVTDKITLEVRLGRNTYQDLIDVDKLLADKLTNSYIMSATQFVNDYTAQYAKFFETNGRADVVNIVSDGVSESTDRKTDVYMDFVDANGKRQLKHFDISLKVGTVKQFGQLGMGTFKTPIENRFAKTIELFSHFGVDQNSLHLSPESFNIENDDDNIEMVRRMYREAAKVLDSKLTNNQSEAEYKQLQIIADAINYFGNSNDPKVKLLQLDQGRYYLLDFKRMRQKLDEINLGVMYQESGKDRLPMIHFYDRDKHTELEGKGAGWKLLTLRLKYEISTSYFRHLIEKEPLMKKLISVKSVMDIDRKV
jgi:hypothetical protein